MPLPIISVTHLEKSVPSGGGRLFLLRDVTLTVEPGEFVSVMGPSGAGKSTLLHILGLHDDGFSGQYVLDQHPVASLAPRERQALQRRTIGFVFQSYHLIDDLTVAENLALPLTYRDVPPRERQALVADTLDRFGIVAKKDLYPSQLSGGQQQLVGVARALIGRPRLLLADEPTGNLHSEQGRDIMALFRRLNEEGMTIVQVTHSEENAGYGHRILRLRDGWLL